MFTNYKTAVSGYVDFVRAALTFSQQGEWFINVLSTTVHFVL